MKKGQKMVSIAIRRAIDDAVRARYLGEGSAPIAKEFGVSGRYVNGRATKLGVTTVLCQHHRKSPLETVVATYRKLGSVRAAAKELGITQMSLRTRLRNHGVLTRGIDKAALAAPQITLNDATLAYIAGIVDGEGTITITLDSDSGSARAVLSVVNTSADLINHLRRVTGFGTVTERDQAKRLRLNTWEWRVFSREAVCLVAAIEPFLIVKKAHAAVIAKLQSQRSDGHLTRESSRTLHEEVRSLSLRSQHSRAFPPASRDKGQ